MYSIHKLLSNTTPLCFMPDGRLICYQHGDIVIILDGIEVQRFLLFHNAEEYILGRCKLLNRFLRLGIRAAIAIDNDNVVLSIGSKLYNLNLETKELSAGYSCDNGIRPLIFTNVSEIAGFDDGIYYGGYLHNFEKNPVSIYHCNGVDSWREVYTFKQGEINHIHNIIPDPYRNCLWILTGDFDYSAAIWKASDNFKKFERVVGGEQMYRGCVAFATPEGLLYASDAPFEKNHIYLLKDDLMSVIIGDLSGSCIYGCQWKDNYVFSTVVEPDGRNESFLRLLLGWERGAGIEDNYARIYCGNLKNGIQVICQEKKDKWPFIFQFGAFRFPSGKNISDFLFFQPISTRKNDLALMKLGYGQ